MTGDTPFLIAVVDGPSEARESLPGVESTGVVRTIIRQVFGDAVANNIEIRYWRQIRLSPHRKARGHVEKARVIAQEAEATESTVYGAVLLLDADHDGDTRLAELEEGRTKAGTDGSGRTAIGIAREMVEAWLLADPALLALPLPKGKTCEELWGKKGDSTSNYPKHVLRRCVLDPRGIIHAEAVQAFDPSRARPNAPSLHAFITEVEALADRQFAR